MEAPLKTSQRHLMWAALATLLAVPPLAIGQIRAEDGAAVPANPGIGPGTGKINPGVEPAVPSSSTDIRKIPTHAEAIAALMAPDDPNPALGPEPPQASNNVANHPTMDPKSSGGDPTTATGGQAAIGGPLSPGASSGGSNNARNQQGTGASETTGARPAGAATENRPGPIGATGQTMPAKFSDRNDTLDRLPIMAWPMRLTDQDRRRIYQTVMADKSQTASGADALAPASELSSEQALNQTHALPDSLQDIALLKRLTYLKTKDKVLLIEPSTRIVVEEITS
jgi:hypothetical protein